MTTENLEVSAVCQVCAVNKPLSSVRRITEAGNRVVFEQDGGYSLNYETQAVTPIRMENGDLWISAPADRVEGFTRPSS